MVCLCVCVCVSEAEVLNPVLDQVTNYVLSHSIPLITILILNVIVMIVRHYGLQ